jgi:2-methylcitrate dehydratase PrpD
VADSGHDAGISARLAARACALEFAHLPAAAVTAAKWSLLDALGVSLAATRLGEGCAAFEQLAAGSAGACLLLGSGATAAAPLAALANGALAHALDFEDSYDGAPVHASAATVPAALAIAQDRGGVCGAELIVALAAGTDLVSRLGLALTASPEQWGWYPPPILGTQGAATAAARLLRLDSAHMSNAWSLALCQGSCSNEFKKTADSVLRAVRDGFAAQAGVQAALLAASGVRGFEQPIEGGAGLYGLYAGGQYEPERLLRDPGVWEGANVSYKLYPSCRGTHAYIDAALRLRADGVTPDTIASVTLTGNELMRMLGEPVERKRAPVTAIDAKFSALFCFAQALVHGRVDLDSFLPGALGDVEVRRLASRTLLVADPALGVHDMSSGVTSVRLVDGSTRVIHIAEPRGGPHSPLSETELVAKFEHCAARALGPLSKAAQELLIDTVLHLERVQDLDATLFRALRPGAI